MRYVSFLLVHINVTVQTNYDNYMFNNHLVKTINFTAFTPPSLLQGKQEITFETLNTQYPSDRFILGKTNNTMGKKCGNNDLEQGAKKKKTSVWHVSLLTLHTRTIKS